MRPKPLLIATLFACLVLTVHASMSHAQGGTVGCASDTSSIQETLISDGRFAPYKVPSLRSALANRDLEFLWSKSYSDSFARPLNVAYNGLEDTELDLFGKSISNEPGTNVFGFPMTRMRLIYDYLQSPQSYRPDFYNTDPGAPVGFTVNQPTYPDADRSHIDTYLASPPFTGDPLYNNGGKFFGDGWDPNNPNQAIFYATAPSWFVDRDNEDLSTGKTGNDILNLNSLNIPAPRPSRIGASGISWTNPDSLVTYGYSHEVQHIINRRADSGALNEIYSVIAEALSSKIPFPPGFDIPYTWNLLRDEGTDKRNYGMWQNLARYLAYNFRGDPSFAARSDDLVWRWARGANRSLVPGLGDRLVDAECAECATKNYFKNELGQPLSAMDRVQKLLHNMRVANFVRNPALAEGQYGYPAVPFYDPPLHNGDFRNVDGSTDDDSVNIELGVALSASHVTRYVTLAGRPANILNPSNSHVLALPFFGSDYWVFRSEASLWTANRTLVIRIQPESDCAVSNFPARLMATAVAYTQQDLAGGNPDSLWKHPEWIDTSFQPVFQTSSYQTDFGGLELVIPDVGSSRKAVLLVISTARDQQDHGNSPKIAYRINAGFRSGAQMNPNPQAVTTYPSTYNAVAPTWSPSGREVAYVKADPGPEYDQIYRRALDGSAEAPLVLPPQPKEQFRPDWSPRGDWVAYDQTAGATQCDIWTYNSLSGQMRQLTSDPEHEYAPVFSPNGQTIAYLRLVPSWPPAVEIRRMKLDGSENILLASVPDADMPRWSPDGTKIYFLVAGTTLKSVPATGGSVITEHALGSGVFDYDLPLSSANRVALGQSWTPLSCFGSGVAVPRVVLRDLTEQVSEAVLYPVGARLRQGRWSFDGTRLAYVSDQVHPSGLNDVFVGQVGYNHAPTWNDTTLLADRGPIEHQPLTLTITATDPDGETVTYYAPPAYLPPGATYNPATGVFYWPDPGPALTDYYIVFRALDGSGALANAVVKMTVMPASGGGCPFVDTRTIAGWQEENSILGRSMDGTLSLDGYRLTSEPAVERGRVAIRVRENEQEYTSLDQVQLTAVDHAADAQSFDLGTRVVIGSKVSAHRVITSDGRDVSSLLTGTGKFYEGSAGDTLYVQWVPPSVGFGAQRTMPGEGGGGGEGGEKEMELAQAQTIEDPTITDAGTLLDAAILESTGILIQRPDGSGGWRTVLHYYPRAKRGEFALDSLSGGPLRLVFVGRHRLYSLFRIEPSGESPTRQVFGPASAYHSRLGNVRVALASAGGTATALAPGDTVTMEFEVTSVPEGKVRDWLFVSRGVYSSSLQLLQNSPESENRSLPTGFALHQNHPNPFSQQTFIRFELPTEAPVRLEIFDAQGRRARTLANGTYPAGFHSAEWNQRDEAGKLLGPGIYLYRIQAGSFRDQKKMVLLP